MPIPRFETTDEYRRYHRPAEELTMPELIQRLKDFNDVPPVPPCRVCGADLSIGSIGGGRPTLWGCSGQEDDPDRPGWLRYKPGRTMADDHYRQSRYEQRVHADHDVLELIRRIEQEAADGDR